MGKFDTCSSKRSILIVIENANGELILTRKITGWKICADYWKLNSVSRKDYFPLAFLDQNLEKVHGNVFYWFLDDFSSYYQIAIALKD